MRSTCPTAVTAWTDVPGCREVVTDGVDGLLVPPSDAHALAQFDERIVIANTISVYREVPGVPDLAP